MVTLAHIKEQSRLSLGSYTTGQVDSWFAQDQLHDKPFTEISCRDLGKVAKGQSLRNAFGASSRVLDVISVKQLHNLGQAEWPVSGHRPNVAQRLLSLFCFLYEPNYLNGAPFTR